jgi:hypothetical protein
MLNPDVAEQLAGVALANVTTEFPYKLDQVLVAERDLALPRTLHPAFWGSYDCIRACTCTGRWPDCCIAFRHTSWHTRRALTWIRG